MSKFHMRGRCAAASLSLCLFWALGVAPSAANLVIPVQGTQDGHPTASTNVTQKSGNATGGTVTTTSVDMSYVTPADGTNYSGTSSIVVTDANGNILQNITVAISDFGNGTTMYTGLIDIYVPPGASVSISVNENNGRGGNFSASFALRNFQP